MADVPKYSFTGHETFPFRYAWLTRGVRAARLHPDVFVRDDGIVLLGVGKNMVSSIRHWCDTLGLIERTDAAGRAQPTVLGESLLGPKGWDPYLENPGTLWLLHWRLVSRVDKASTWCLAFTRWSTDAFSRQALADWLKHRAQESGNTSANSASIERDVDVFVRTYVPAQGSRRDYPIEDSFDCPLIELGIIRQVGDFGGAPYQFVRGFKPALPDLIFLCSLLEYWERIAPAQQTLSFESILHGFASPGAAFKLTENALAERLESLPAWSHLHYDDTAGMRVLLRRSDSAIDPLSVLERYYQGA